MPSQSEKTHGANVANLEDLYTAANSLGTRFKPPQQIMLVPQLQTLFENAKAILKTVAACKSVLDPAVNARRDLFDQLRSRVSEVVSTFEMGNPTKRDFEDLKGLQRKITGYNPNRKKKGEKSEDQTEDELDKSISTSQRAMDSLIDHLEAIILFLENFISVYTPQDEHLTEQGLKDYLAQLRTANTTVITLYQPYKDAISARNEYLYRKPNGLVHVARNVKTYIRRKFGLNSDEYGKVRNIPFHILYKFEEDKVEDSQ